MPYKNIEEVETEYNFIANLVTLKFGHSHFRYLTCYDSLMKELHIKYPKLAILYSHVVNWLIFLYENKKIKLLLYSFYFRVEGKELDFDFSSLIKIQKISPL